MDAQNPPIAEWDDAYRTWAGLSGGMHGFSEKLGHPLHICIVWSLLSTIKRRDDEISRLRAQAGET